MVRITETAAEETRASWAKREPLEEGQFGPKLPSRGLSEGERTEGTQTRGSPTKGLRTRPEPRHWEGRKDLPREKREPRKPPREPQKGQRPRDGAKRFAEGEARENGRLNGDGLPRLKATEVKGASLRAISEALLCIDSS